MQRLSGHGDEAAAVVGAQEIDDRSRFVALVCPRERTAAQQTKAYKAHVSGPGNEAI